MRSQAKADQMKEQLAKLVASCKEACAEQSGEKVHAERSAIK